MSNQKFSEITFYPFEAKSDSKLLARGSVIIGELVKVNFSVLEGSKGKFVTLPSEKSNKTDDAGKIKYFPLAIMATRELSDELNVAVLAEFDKRGSAKPATKSGSTSKSVPF